VRAWANNKSPAAIATELLLVVLATLFSVGCNSPKSAHISVWNNHTGTAGNVNRRHHIVVQITLFMGSTGYIYDVDIIAVIYESLLLQRLREHMFSARILHVVKGSFATPP